MNLQDKFNKAKPIADKLFSMGNGSLFVDLGQYDSDSGVRISYFPPPDYHEDTVRYIMEIMGKLVKIPNGNMQAEKDGITIFLFGVMKCEIIGYESVKEPVLVETGEYREIKKPIYNCKSPIAV